MAGREARSIAHLEQYVAELSKEDQGVFYRIFHLQTVTGRLVVPASMHGWIERAFGDVETVREQRVVKITNLITLDGALFNPLRGARPLDLTPQPDVLAAIESTRGGPFCHPETLTPEDLFGPADAERSPGDTPGRVRGKYCVTASNVAKYDGYHSLVIFDEHNPLHITTERVHDYIDTALRWAKRAHNADAEAKYFFLMWNCLWKGGASVVHGHMQVTLGRGMHYAHVEHWRRQAVLYRLAHGANYFDDLYRVHEALGLARRIGETRVIAYLTPVKEKELLLISPTRWIDNDDFKDAIGAVLQDYTGALGVQSFNLALFQRPIDVAVSTHRLEGVRTWEDWEDFPAIVRIVDRGELQRRTTDVGCMELYGSSVISADPFAVIGAIGAA